MIFWRSILIAAVGIGAAAQANAQTSDDWDVSTDAGRRLTVASVEYESGALLRVQCQAGQLDVAISGLPASPADSRPYARSLPDGRLIQSYWTGAPATGTLLSGEPVRDARSFKAGGALKLASGADAHPPLSIDLDLPSQSNGIDQVLTACGRPLVDPRDMLIAVNDLMLEAPSLEISDKAARYSDIRIEISCVVAAGRLAECQSDHETPTAPEAGEDTARLANGHRLRLRDPAAAEGQLLDVVLTGKRIRRRS